MTNGIRLVVSALGGRWWFVVFFFVATLWVWQRYAVVRVGRRVATLTTRLSDLVETRDALLAENTTLSAHGRIEAIATARLGLRPVRRQQVINLDTRPSRKDAVLEKSGRLSGSLGRKGG